MRRLLLALFLAVSTAGSWAASFADAVNATPLGMRPGAAFFLVELLERQAQPERAEQLRRELWRQHLAVMRGEAVPEAQTLGEAIQRGAQLPELGSVFLADWRVAYNAAAALSYAPAQPTGSLAAVPVPASVDQPQGLIPIEAGLWVQPQAGRDRFVLTVKLRPSRGVALPPQALGLRFGSADAGLILACRTDPAPADEHAFERQIFHADYRVDLVCEGLGESRWRVMLPVLLIAARDGGTAPELLPRDPRVEPKNSERRLWRLWGSYDTRLRDWQQRWQQSTDASLAQRQWRAGTEGLAEPELEPLPPTAKERFQALFNPSVNAGRATGAAGRDKPDKGFKEALDRLLPVVVVSALAWGFFGAGRLLLRGASLEALIWATVGMAAVLQAIALVSVWGGGRIQAGDGWARWGVFGAGLALVVVIGSGSVVAILMHRLHRLLDAEDRGWGQVIVSGWRQAFWMFGSATRGEFWGFVLFALWVWAFAVALGGLLKGVIAVCLLVPLWSLCWRRALSLTAAEFWLGLLVIALFLLGLKL